LGGGLGEGVRGKVVVVNISVGQDTSTTAENSDMTSSFCAIHENARSAGILPAAGVITHWTTWRAGCPHSHFQGSEAFATAILLLLAACRMNGEIKK
jgi:hypothetical protein